MRKINFTKMIASGNDFVIISSLERSFIPNQKNIQKICERKFGVGADGLLLLGKSKKAQVRMRIFNSDGSEAEMCGNGARCATLYLENQKAKNHGKISLETKAGIIRAQVNGKKVRINLTDPKDLLLDIPLQINQRQLKINFINTGVPHAVIFAEGLDEIDVVKLGRLIRYHRKFAPRGTNVNFVEVFSNQAIKIRTYERGVEEETLACGTGAVAAALIFSRKFKSGNKIQVHTKSKEVLTVYFQEKNHRLSDIWLEGKARLVFRGQITC
jgi:diaminopimelate epimerase